MLILTRRMGETICIGDGILVTIMGVQGTQVSIGIQAPKSVAVHREEIFNRIRDTRAADSESLDAIPKLPSSRSPRR